MSVSINATHQFVIQTNGNTRKIVCKVISDFLKVARCRRNYEWQPLLKENAWMVLIARRFRFSRASLIWF